MEQHNTAPARQIVSGGVRGPIAPGQPSFPGAHGEGIFFTRAARPGSGAPAAQQSAYGLLKAYADPALLPEEEGAWEQAAAEKHALH